MGIIKINEKQPKEIITIAALERRIEKLTQTFNKKMEKLANENLNLIYVLSIILLKFGNSIKIDKETADGYNKSDSIVVNKNNITGDFEVLLIKQDTKNKN